MIVERRTPMPVPADELFAWHARPGALQRLLPPWEDVRLRRADPGLAPGSRLELELGVGWSTATWVLNHTEVDPGRGFTVVQEKGPFARWRHRHRFEPAGRGSVLTDTIDAEPPLGPLGEIGEPWARRRLRRVLRYRHDLTADDLALHARFASAPRRTVAISGSSGFIGRAVSTLLTTGGHRVVPLVRRPPGPGEIRWDPAAGRLEPAALEGVDAVIHLAGETIGDRRWTPKQRERILTSRTEGTATIVAAMVAAPAGPRTLIAASAIGLYGDRGDEILTEAAAPGAGFLARVVEAWEASAERARGAGIRTVETRFAPVLSPGGGALARMLPPFRLGLGGPLGDGRQWMSWIGLDDAAGILLHALLDEKLSGPVNAVAPEPIRNRDFGATLGAVLGRPAVLAVPRFALRAVLDGLADEGLLASIRVVPERLLAAGYRFRHPTLEAALRHCLGRQHHRE